jgi:TonB family protein
MDVVQVMDLKRLAIVIGTLGWCACSTAGTADSEVGHCNPEGVHAALLKHKSDFAACYSTSGEKRSGRVEVETTVQSNGEPSGSEIHMSTIDSPTLEQCLLKVVRSIRFPSPQGGSIAELHIPFKFSPEQNQVSGVEYIESQD